MRSQTKRDMELAAQLKAESANWTGYNSDIVDKASKRLSELASDSEDSDNFDEIEGWALRYAEHFLNNKLDEVHNGDCTKQPCPCPLCVLENYLVDYKQYYFDEDKWRQENGK